MSETVPKPQPGEATTEQLLQGRYRIGECLGRGGLGAVYRAVDTILSREVAIKLLHTAIVDGQQARRFSIEATALGALDDPNIVKVWAVGTDEHDQPFIALELLRGDVLSKRVEQAGPLTSAETTRIAEAALDALSHAHSRQIIHRDLKPQNLMLTNEGELKILDFGLAKVIGITDQRVTKTGEILGTPQYITPEQCTTGDVDARTDIYALGATLFFLLTGEPPFDGDNVVTVMFKQLNEQPDFNKIKDGHLRAVVAKALQKNPADRFSSADEMKAALTANLVASLSTPNSVRKRTTTSGRKNIGFAVAAAALAVTLGMVAQVLRPQEPPKPHIPLYTREDLDRMQHRIDNSGVFTQRDAEELEKMRDAAYATKDANLIRMYEKQCTVGHHKLKNYSMMLAHYPRWLDATRAVNFDHTVVQHIVGFLLFGDIAPPPRYRDAEEIVLNEMKCMKDKNALEEAWLKYTLANIYANAEEREKLTALDRELDKIPANIDFEIVERAYADSGKGGPFTAGGYLASTHSHRNPLVRAIAYASRGRGGREKEEFRHAQTEFTGAIQEAQAALADPNGTAADKQRAELLIVNVRKELQAMEHHSQ